LSDGLLRTSRTSEVFRISYITITTKFDFIVIRLDKCNGWCALSLIQYANKIYFPFFTGYFIFEDSTKTIGLVLFCNLQMFVIYYNIWTYEYIYRKEISANIFTYCRVDAVQNNEE